MPASLIQYRLRVRDASTLANPDGTTDAFVISSVPTDIAPYIASAPNGDGQEVDPITGAVRTGSYTVEVVDANTGTDATGTIRYLTSRLEDATYRQQLLSRRAYVEIRTDGGAWSTLIAGYILGVRLISPMRYAIAVGDTRRVEQTQNIFQGGALGTYTTRGCVIGGPVTADWGPVKARGGWKYRVAKSGNDVTLTFIEGYAATFNSPIVTDWRKVVRPEMLETIANYRTVNPYAIGGGSSFVTAYTTSAYDFTAGDWVVASGITVWVGTTATNAAPVRALLVSDSQGPTLNVINLYWPSCPHSTGDTVYVSLSTTDVTEVTPLYLDAHPVDIVTAIWTNARIRYDAAGAWITTIKALIGPNVRLACRFTSAPKIAEFLESAIFGPFGISARTTSAGLQELFPTRIRTDVVPSLTLDVTALRSGETVVFDLDEATAVSSIALTQQVFGQATYVEGQASTNGYTQTQSSGNPLDAVVVSTVTQTAQYLDAALTVFAGRAINYSVPGMIHTATDWQPATTPQLDAIAVGVFDRFGRGAATADVEVLAGTSAAAAQVGDELYFEGPSYPNKGYRIGESTVGARIMQVVRRTETPSGPVLKLLDSGLAAQPATAATVSIAAASGAPTTTAAYTITNAATLNATGVISVRVEYATGGTTPTGGIDFATYAPGQIPTGAVNLPSQTTSGATVWVRVRSEQAGRRPTAWSAWTSVTLSSIPTISGASASNIRQTAATVSWTNTSSTLPIVVFAYQGSGAPASWTPFRVASVPAGSTSTIVRNLTGPSVAWTIGLAYESAGVLGPVTAVTLTTNSTTDTSNRPAGLAVIAGVDDVTLPQGIALAMWPSDQALDLVIERSTTSGSGFAEIARVAGSTPTYVDSRPRNGVTYYYRIAHVLGGYGLSTYSQEVSAIARGVARDIVRPDAVGPVVQVETTESGTTGTVTLTVTDPQGRVDQVRFRHRTGGGAWSAWTVDTSVPYSYTETLPSTGFLDIQYEVNGYNAAGVYGLLAGGTESFDRGTGADMVSVVGTFTATSGLLLAFSADSDTGSIKFASSTTSQPVLATVQAQTAINGRNYSTTLPGPYASGTTVYVSVLAYTGAGGTGSESSLFEYRFTRDATGLTYSQCVATMATSTATQIVVTVTGTAATGSPTVQLVAVTGSAVQAGGAAVGVAVPSGSSWAFTRGAALGQPGGAQFRAVLAGTQSDDDFIEIPEQGRDTTYLTTRARVLSTSATQLVVRVAVLDAYSNLTASVSYLTQGVPAVSPTSPQNVTTVVGTTFPAESPGYYVDFTIDRPAFGAGTGRVVFTAFNASRIADADSVDVPAQERDTIALTSRARIFSQSATQMVVRYAVASPVALSPNTGTITYVTEGLSSVSPEFPQTITPETNTQVTEVAGSYVDFTIPRPSAGSVPGRIAFQGIATGRTATNDAVDIQPQDRENPSLALVTTPGSTQYTIVATYTGTLVYQKNGGITTSAGPSPFTLNATRPAIGNVADTYNFRATLNGVTTSDSAVVPAVDAGAVSITAFYMSFDYANDWIIYNYTITGLPSGAFVDTYAVLNGTQLGVLPTAYVTSTATAVGSPVPIDPSGSTVNDWQFWIEVVSGASVLATSVTRYEQTYAP